MFHENLVETLLKRGIINRSTCVLVKFISVDSTYKSLQLQELCRVNSVRKNDIGKHVWSITRLDTGETLLIFTTDILTFDGMSPVDVAKAYDILPDGSTKDLGRKRGRPKKIR